MTAAATTTTTAAARQSHAAAGSATTSTVEVHLAARAVNVDDGAAVAMNHDRLGVLANNHLAGQVLVNDPSRRRRHIDGARLLDDRRAHHFRWQRSGLANDRGRRGDSRLGGKQRHAPAESIEVKPLQARPGNVALEDERRLGIARLRLAKNLADRLSLAVDNTELVNAVVYDRGIKRQVQVKVLLRAGRVSCSRLGVLVSVAGRNLGDIPGNALGRLGGHTPGCHQRGGQHEHESAHRTNLLIAADQRWTPSPCRAVAWRGQPRETTPP